MTTGKGLLNILLHAHLPFIKHPEYESFLEENWLFEALTESYLPQLRMVNRLDSESIPINLTFSFSPTLIAMLRDDLLKERYRRYLLKHIELGEK
jgi:1,4-alpha-glucan branching enzyme